MGKPPPEIPLVRKSVSLRATDWAEIQEERRLAGGGRIPSENEMLRDLVREALDARQKKRARRA